MPAVHCQGLRKRYGPHVALKGLDLEVPEGSLFGFLGPNGAGKSTTLRILAGLVRADAGTARLFGIDARDHARAARRASFLIENAVFPPHLTARQVLRRAAAFGGTREDPALLDRVGIGAAADRATRGFSHGMRQRLGIACALLGKPDLLVLDEPQNGLDPAGLRAIRGILREEHARGATVLVSVHRLGEVEGLCTHAAIVAAGAVLRSGDLATLLHDGRPRFRLVVSDPARALALLPGAARDGDALVVAGTREAAAAAADACVRAGLRLFEMAPVVRTLDDLFLSEVGA